jgi:glycosyltransferase involved in cell wall biosynthesis
MPPRMEFSGVAAADRVALGGPDAGPAGRPDVLLVSLGSTAGLRTADRELEAALSRGGAAVRLARARPPREVRTLAATDLAWALAARRAAQEELRLHPPRAILYTTTTAALLWPAPGAIRFDSPSAVNRPGRHGIWQRALERRRLAAARLLVPLSAQGLAGAPPSPTGALVVPVPVDPSGPVDGSRDLAAVTYAADPRKKGLDRVLRAWDRARRTGETLVVAGTRAPFESAGVRSAGLLDAREYRALLRRARVFVTAPRWEDYGSAQLEALADGCALVTTPSPGPYAALPLARTLDPRLVSDDLAPAIRAALDRPLPGYAERAAQALAPYRRAAVDRLVARELLPRLLGAG